MSIIELEFHDLSQDWHLSKTTFDDINLLVGNSGVGKTRILNSINEIKNAALIGVSHPSISWYVKLKVNEHIYDWVVDVDEWTNYVSEKISRDDVLYVERTIEEFRYNQQALPRLKNDESAVSLLRAEKLITPLYEALNNIVLSDFPKASYQYFDDINKSYFKTYDTLDALREIHNHVSLLNRIMLLSSSFLHIFQSVIDDYKDIFPTVVDVDIRKFEDFDTEKRIHPLYKSQIALGIKEQSVDTWIVANSISSGMYRTLIHLFEFVLSPFGTIFLIDEVENSLGVNCLDAVIERVKQQSQDLQFILTSHHPYIINNVDIDHWRLVTRNGSNVLVKNGNQIAALKGESAQDRFIRLINSNDFEEGVQ